MSDDTLPTRSGPGGISWIAWLYLGTPEKANRRLDLNAANELRVGGSHARLYSD
jgi:hypothetical protein